MSRGETHTHRDMHTHMHTQLEHRTLKDRMPTNTGTRAIQAEQTHTHTHTLWFQLPRIFTKLEREADRDGGEERVKKERGPRRKEGGVEKGRGKREVLNDLITVSAGNHPNAISGLGIRTTHKTGSVRTCPSPSSLLHPSIHPFIFLWFYPHPPLFLRLCTAVYYLLTIRCTYSMCTFFLIFLHFSTYPRDTFTTLSSPNSHYDINDWSTVVLTNVYLSW